MRRHTDDVRKIVAEVLNVPLDRIGEDASTQTVPQWDSLAHLNICLRIQESYGTEMDMETIAHATSIRKLASLVP
jgi:acyl carrier protein